MEIEIKLKGVEENINEKIITFLENDGYNESFITHFFEQANSHEDPVKFIKTKYPDILD